jgi:hypothetical protein
MKRYISPALIATAALILFAGGVVEHSAAQSATQARPNAMSGHGTQDNGQQQNSQPPAGNTDDSRRDDVAKRSDVPSEGERVTLPPDTKISVRIADEINSSKHRTGDMFTGIVDPSVLVHDQVVIPRGTEAHVRMADAKKGGHVHGKAKVSLELVSLVVNGRRLEVDSDIKTNDKGVLAAKGKAEKSSVSHLGSATGPAGPAGAAAGPVIAVFAAPKVEVKPNTRVEFTLAEPFTFEKPPVTGVAQSQ